jgi:hypothetical protein
VDGGGNVGTETNRGWYYGRDVQPPLTAALFDPWFPSGENGWDTTPVTVTLEARDDRSGVGDTMLRVNEGTWRSYAAPVVVTAQGTTTIAYHSVDLVGNLEAVQTATLRLDSVAPSTTADLVTGTASLVLTAQDSTSGLAHTVYQVDAGTWQTYTTPIAVAPGVSTMVAFYSVDVAGNVEGTQRVTVCPGCDGAEHRVYLPLVSRKR